MPLFFFRSEKEGSSSHSGRLGWAGFVVGCRRMTYSGAHQTIPQKGGILNESKYCISPSLTRQQTQWVPLLPNSSRSMMQGECSAGFSWLREYTTFSGMPSCLHHFNKSMFERGTFLNFIIFLPQVPRKGRGGCR